MLSEKQYERWTPSMILNHSVFIKDRPILQAIIRSNNTNRES